MAQVNIVNISRVLNEENYSRIESEFYSQEYALNKKTLNAIPHTFLGRLLQQPVKTGHTPSMKNRTYYGGDVAFVKTDNLHDNIIYDSFRDYLSSKGNAIISGSELQEGDILTTIIGATFDVVPRSSLVPRNILPANINQNIALIRVAPYKAVPEYVNIYLNTKYGKTYLHYLSRQTGQVNLNCREVEQVIVPLLSKGFQQEIGRIVKNAYQSQDNAHSLYDATEKYLLDALGMVGVTPSIGKYSVRGLAESFYKSNRIDAEYYQEKYDDIEVALSTQFTVKSICNVLDSVFVPHDFEYKYIELTNVGANGNITGCTIAPYRELPSRARRLVHSGQIIVSSIEGSLSSCALITDEYDGAICSTGFYVIDSTKINAETLLMLFKTMPVQALLKKRCSGTILTAISKSALKAMPLPLIDDLIQKRIATDVQRSFSLRRESERLLKTAKHAVEFAIESGEDKAMTWLNTQNGTSIQ